MKQLLTINKETLTGMVAELNMEEAMALNVWAVNTSVDKALTKAERKVADFISDLAIERFAKLHTEANKKQLKASASIEFGKYVDLDIFEESNGRYITVDIEVKASTKAEVEEAFDLLAEKLEAEASVEINWSTCPTVDEYNGTWLYQESFCIEYEHGFMTELKKELRADFKAVKKELGFR